MDFKELHLMYTQKKGPDGTGDVFGFLAGKVLYLPEYIDEEYLKTYKTRNLLRSIGAGILVAFGLIGVAALVWFVLQNPTLDYLSAQFWIEAQSWLLVVFWLSMLTNLILVYQIARTTQQQEDVMSREYERGMSQPPAIQTREELNKLPRTGKLNIANALTADTMQLVRDAYFFAQKYGHSEVAPLHYIIAGITGSGRVQNIIVRLGIDYTDLAKRFGTIMSRYGYGQTKPLFNAESKKILFKAYTSSYEHLANRVQPEEMFLAAFEEDEHIQEIFFDLKVTVDDVRNTVSWIRIQEKLRERYLRYKSKGRSRSKTGIDRAMTSLSSKILDEYSQDLTRLAQLGYLELTVGRSKEIDEIYRMFESASKNVILIGQSGVGKNAIVEGLAERVIGDDVPEFLREKRIVSLSVSRLLAGASAARAQQRLLNVLYDAANAGNIVLFIDNIQDLVGVTATGAQGLDLSDVLAEVLQKNIFYFIAATDPQSYTRFIERTPLGAALRPVRVDEMTVEQTILTLESKAGIVESRNSVYFSYQAIKKIAELTDRYVHDQYAPQKAINAMEEVGVYVKNTKGAGTRILPEDVAQLLTEKLGIPVTDVGKKEGERLMNLDALLHERVVGQDEAVSAVATALKRARTELRDANRPIANLLFLGPTGVGKTELTKAVAQVYFGSEDNMIRLDMSEYQNKADLSKLIGSAPGTAGPKEGYLTEAVRRNPFSIVLLDELEKAHADILNVFLQVMEDGRLTDANGRTVDFTNVILVATSNAGAQFIQDQIQAQKSYEEVKSGLIEGELSKDFRPEFLNRFDAIIVFKPLTQEEVFKIAKLMIKKVSKNLEPKGINFRASEEAIRELAKKGFDPVYGARPLRRVIQDQVDNALADYLIEGKLTRRDVAVLEAGGSIRIEKAQRLD